MSNDTLFRVDIENLDRCIWGEIKNPDLVERWEQGFSFSPFEPLSLVQTHGGPCSILAPVQAFMLAEAAFGDSPIVQDLDGLHNLSDDDVNKVLITSLAKILLQAGNEAKLILPCNNKLPSTPSEGTTESSDIQAEATAQNSSDVEKTQTKELESLGQEVESQAAAPATRYRYQRCSTLQSLSESIQQNLPHFKSKHGVLLFLYSIISTKTLEKLKEELADSCTEPLIDPTHGHGSQALVNLLVTGRGVNQLFDGEIDLGGMKLHGITSRPLVGFLSQLEALRYLEVGSFLKNPRVPVWLVASESHITTLISMKRELVVEEQARDRACRAFAARDTDGAGFIPSTSLGPLLNELGLCSEQPYVEFMQSSLDPDNLGLILLPAFLDGFYPQTEQTSKPTEADFLFCNNLHRSNPEEKVRFKKISASLPEFPDMESATDNIPLQQCLATLWPTVQLSWTGADPSIN